MTRKKYGYLILGVLVCVGVLFPLSQGQGDESNGWFRAGERDPSPRSFNSDEYIIEMLNTYGLALFQYGIILLFVVGVGVIILKVFYDK